MNRQPEITAQTKKEITQAFWQIYCRKPINKITVREIVTLAGYNHSTFYAHFLDVYDVLEQLENKLLPDLNSPQAQNLIEKSDIRLSVEHCSDIYKRYNKYYVVLLGPKGDPAFREKLVSIFGEFIKKHLKQPSDVSNFELDCVVTYAASSLLAVLTFYYQSKEKPSAQGIINLIIDLMNHGVAKKLGWEIAIKENS